MVRFLQRLAVAGFTWTALVGAAFAQTAIPGISLTGTPPTGFTLQNFIFHCSATPCASNNAWPAVEIYNGTGFNSLTNPFYISPATSATFAVTGTFWQTTQPVSGTFWQATQPVSGTVTANIGTVNTLALAANQPTAAAQASTTSGQTGTLMEGAATTSAPTPSNGTTTPLSIDSANGALRVEGGTAGGPLGTQAIGNSQAVNPATASLWSIQNAPDIATNTAVTIVDSGITCSPTPPPIQTQCTGTATAGSFASVAISGQQAIGVVASLTSGSVSTVSFHSEFSWDGGTTYYGRGLFLDSELAPIWQNGIGNNVFSGSTSVPAGATNYRVRATTLTGTSPNINIKIILSQSASGTYIYNLPTSGAGTNALAGVATQGINGGVPVGTNATQQAGLTLAAPTAPGTPASSGLVPTVNFAGTVTASISGFAPNGNTAVPVSVGATATAATLSPGGATVLFSNTGANVLYVRLGNGTVAATVNDIPIQPSSGCALVVGVNLDFSAISPAGSTLNVDGGSGVGNCPSGGGGGGSGGASGNVFQASIFPNGSASTATTTQVIAASGSLTIYLVNYAFQVDQAATGPATFQIVSGQGSNCVTSQKALTAVWDTTANNGISRGTIGVLNASNPGDEVCVKTTAAQPINWELGAVQQ